MTMVSSMPVPIAAPTAPTATLRKFNSYRASAPIAVTLNLLWKATDRAACEFANCPRTEISVKLAAICSELHERTTALDCELKKAFRFSQGKAQRQLRNLCEKVLADLDIVSETDENYRLYRRMLDPVRQIASDRLARMKAIS